MVLSRELLPAWQYLMFPNAVSVSYSVYLIDLALVISLNTWSRPGLWPKEYLSELHLLHPSKLAKSHSQILFGYTYPAGLYPTVVSPRSELSGVAVRMIPERVSKPPLKSGWVILLLLCCSALLY